MILFRYFASHGLETLLQSRLRVSRVSAYNDPFDCMYKVTGTMTVAKARDYIRSRLTSPRFLQMVQRQFPGLRTPKQARRFIKHRRDLVERSLVEGYPSVVKQNVADREALLDRNLRVVCFSGSDSERRRRSWIFFPWCGAGRRFRTPWSRRS